MLSLLLTRKPPLQVKCDGAQPCAKCRRASAPCVFAKLPPKRGPPKQYVEMLENRLRRVEMALNSLEDLQSAPGNDAADGADGAGFDGTRERGSISGDPYRMVIDEHSVDSVLSPTDQHRRSIGGADMFPLDVAESEGRRSSSSSLTFDQSVRVDNPIYRLRLSVNDLGQAVYITDLPTRNDRLPWIGQEPDPLPADGADTITLEPPLPTSLREPIELPPPDIVDSLIQTYFEHIHPYTPMIHHPTFIQQMESPNGAPSILLLNTIFAVSARWSNHPSIQQPPSSSPPGSPVNSTGSPSDAGQVFYRRALALLDDFVDIPRVSTVQALILIIRYQEQVRRPGSFFRPWLYLGIAMRMVSDLGLNKSSAKWKIEPWEAETRRRTFWMVFLYDRILRWVGS